MLSDADLSLLPSRLDTSTSTSRTASAAKVWHELGQRLAVAPVPRRLRVQHLVLAQDDVGAVATALQQAGRQLGLDLTLDARDGDLVLLDRRLAGSMSAQLLAAFSEGRPCLMLDIPQPGPATRQSLRRQLRQQLAALPMLQPLLAPGAGCFDDGAVSAPDSAFDSSFDSSFDSVWPVDEPDASGAGDAGVRLLQQLHKRRGDAAAAPLRASYGPGADLHFDFSRACVQGNVQALQLLRLQQQLPVLVPHLPAPDGAEALPLHHALWDLGVAAAALPLLAAPDDWWHTPLSGQGAALAGTLTRVPRYLDILRRLDAGAVTPAELRREARISVIDLRRVLQACLLLSLARFSPATPTSKQETPFETAEPQS